MVIALIAPILWPITFYQPFYPKPDEFKTYAPLLYSTGMVKEGDVKSFVVTKYVSYFNGAHQFSFLLRKHYVRKYSERHTGAAASVSAPCGPAFNTFKNTPRDPEWD